MSTETGSDDLDDATREWARMWAAATLREQERQHAKRCHWEDCPHGANCVHAR